MGGRNKIVCGNLLKKQVAVPNGGSKKSFPNKKIDNKQFFLHIYFRVMNSNGSVNKVAGIGRL